jgi:hypothetical protein
VVRKRGFDRPCIGLSVLVRIVLFCSGIYEFRCCFVRPCSPVFRKFVSKPLANR